MRESESLEVISLAMAQSEIKRAITESGLTIEEVARRSNCSRLFIQRFLEDTPVKTRSVQYPHRVHGLTIRTMAHILGACGFELRFVRIPRNGM
jgi:transcriptional regulator with XRE-family HTH domain